MIMRKQIRDAQESECWLRQSASPYHLDEYKADKIVNKAMNNYWKANGSGEWHFIRKKSQGTFLKSKVLDRLKNEHSRLGFMDS